MYQTFFIWRCYFDEIKVDTIEDDFTDKIINTDILNSLYKIFDSIDEKMVVNIRKKVYRFKIIHDNENSFFMISNDYLQGIIKMKR